VGFSYGGVGAAILAAREPARVISLALIEPPIYSAAPDNPAVQEFARAGDAFLSGQADARTEHEFLVNAGIDPDAASSGNRKLIRRAIDAARGGRSPSEADVDLDSIKAASVPTMVVSGGHHEAIEAVCNGLAERLDARREVIPGAGHAVPRTPSFNQILEDFLRESGGTARSRKA
jgi:pimeloyl-ACP methyl ester carboxylesterase